MGMEVKAWHIAAFSIAGVAFVMGVVLLLVYCWCKPRRELRNRSKPPSTRLLATDHVVNDIAEAPAFMEEGKEKTNPIFNKRLSTFSSSSSMGERDASIANGTDRAASGVGSTSKQDPELVQNGRVTAAGMTRLKERLPHADFSKLESNPEVTKVGQIFTGETLCGLLH